MTTEPEPIYYEWDELLNATLDEVSRIPSSLLAQAVGEDQQKVRELLYMAGTLTADALAGDDNATAELQMIHLTLADIALKYGIRARVALEESVNRFIFRLISTTFDAAIPG